MWCCARACMSCLGSFCTLRWSTQCHVFARLPNPRDVWILLGTTNANTSHTSRPVGWLLPWCIRAWRKWAVGNWNIQRGEVLTLLQEDIFKWYHNVSYMKRQQAQVCSLIQSPGHLLIESCLMDIYLEWGGDVTKVGRGIVSSCVCKGRVVLWLHQEMLIRKSDSRKGFTAFLETQICD